MSENNYTNILVFLCALGVFAVSSLVDLLELGKWVGLVDNLAVG